MFCEMLLKMESKQEMNCCQSGENNMCPLVQVEWFSDLMHPNEAFTKRKQTEWQGGDVHIGQFALVHVCTQGREKRQL